MLSCTFSKSVSWPVAFCCASCGMWLVVGAKMSAHRIQLSVTHSKALVFHHPPALQPSSFFLPCSRVIGHHFSLSKSLFHLITHSPSSPCNIDPSSFPFLTFDVSLLETPEGVRWENSIKLDGSWLLGYEKRRSHHKHGYKHEQRRQIGDL